MKRCCVVLCAVIVAGVAGSGTAVSQNQPNTPQAPPPGNTEQGKKLYASYGCYQCHGYEAQGSSATGPRLGPRPLAFASFARYVRQPTGQMPPYTMKVASDADLADIYAFVAARPSAPPVADIPLLK